MGQESWFDGEPVLELAHETDRRSFLRWAGLVGVGTTWPEGGVYLGAFEKPLSKATVLADVTPFLC